MNREIRRAWLIGFVITSFSLAGCTGSVNSCPPIVSYTSAQQEQAATELDTAVQAGAVILPMMMGDYGVLREQIRACRK